MTLRRYSAPAGQADRRFLPGRVPQYLLALAFLLGAVGVTTAQAQERLDLRIIESGHSLTDPIPGPLRAFAIAAGAPVDVVVDSSTIPGSPMEWRWDNEPYPGAPNARTGIADYDLLVLTERVPLSNTLPYHHSKEMALRWLDNAYRLGAGGKGAKTMLYASWVDIDSGPDALNEYGDPERHIPWRERLPLEFARWIEIADFVNDNLPDGGQPMAIIPATLVMAAAYDDIAAGKAPGLTDISELFGDTIHLNDAGAYLVALTHYAAIYDRDPRGLPSDIGLAGRLSEEQALWMQTLVWDVVRTYKDLADRRAADGASLSAEALQACLWANLRGGSSACP